MSLIDKAREAANALAKAEYAVATAKWRVAHAYSVYAHAGRIDADDMIRARYEMQQGRPGKREKFALDAMDKALGEKVEAESALKRALNESKSAQQAFSDALDAIDDELGAR